jgi:uncharacterized protein involved in exopolysaccharide biosynthesis
VENELPPGRYPPPYWYRSPHYGDDEEVTLADIWHALTWNRWLILGMAFLGTVLALVYALFATPIYRADTLLAPVEADRRADLVSFAARFGGLAELAGVTLPRGGDLETALATLKSREFITRFINEEQLKPLLFHANWNADSGTWIPSESSVLDKVKDLFGLKEPALRDPRLAPGEPTDWEAYKLFAGDVLQISTDQTTGLVTVSVEWGVPDLAARWANRLVERLNAELRQQAIERAKNSVDYLREQIAQTSVADLRTVLFRLIEEHTKTVTLASVDPEYAFQVIDPAVVPQERTKPRRSLIVFLGFIVGGVAGTLLALFRTSPYRVGTGREDS